MIPLNVSLLREPEGPTGSTDLKPVAAITLDRLYPSYVAHNTKGEILAPIIVL
jgi:hypothetical protein